MSSEPAPPRRFNPAAWLLILLPASSVVASTLYGIVAFRVFDGVVVDDYYARGKAINLVLARDEAALAAGLGAMVELAPADGVVDVDVTSSAAMELPDRLRISFLHATVQGQDQSLELVREASGRYGGRIDKLSRGKYHVQLETPGWRLVGELRSPGERACHLQPAR